SLFGLGIANPEIEIYFPLSKSFLLLLRHDLEREDAHSELLKAGKVEDAKRFRFQEVKTVYGDCSAQFVRQINGLIAHYAQDFVYAYEKQQWLFDILKGQPGGIRSQFN